MLRDEGLRMLHCRLLLERSHLLGLLLEARLRRSILETGVSSHTGIWICGRSSELRHHSCLIRLDGDRGLRGKDSCLFLVQTAKEIDKIRGWSRRLRRLRGRRGFRCRWARNRILWYRALRPANLSTLTLRFKVLPPVLVKLWVVYVFFESGR